MRAASRAPGGLLSADDDPRRRLGRRKRVRRTELEELPIEIDRAAGEQQPKHLHCLLKARRTLSGLGKRDPVRSCSAG